MHFLRALSALLLKPLFTNPTTVLLPSDSSNNIPNPSIDATNDTANVFKSFNSLRSSTSLVFDLFGHHIPSHAVNAAFKGAITRIHPFLQAQPDIPITDDDFHYLAVGGSVQISVTAARRHGISWQQLDFVLRHAYKFINGDLGERRLHMQELSFEIIQSGTDMGNGLVSYRPPNKLQSRDSTSASLKIADDTELLLIPIPTDPLLNAPPLNATHFRVPNTPFKLIFGFLGDRVPDSGVLTAFEGAHTQIIPFLGAQPATPIPGERFQYRKEGVEITVLAKSGTAMTWKQLSWVLGGIYGFMTGTPNHYQLLTCEISYIGHGMVGYASVWYYHHPVEAPRKRSFLNTTTNFPLLLIPNPLTETRFPVPNTPITLTFDYFGLSIPKRELDAAISAALDKIRLSFHHHGANPVPGNHFFQVRDDVRISIFTNVPLVLSWVQLHGIVLGLLLFVRGGEAERGGEEHYQVMNFDAEDVRTGKFAYGTVRYLAPIGEKGRMWGKGG